MATKGRILYIDDSATLLTQVKARLVTDGYDVGTSTNANIPGVTLRDRDLVIMDFHMPGIDTPKALLTLRAAAASVDSRCVFYLYTTDKSEASTFKRHGFDGVFMMKGDVEALLSQVRAAFRLIEMRKLQPKAGP
jgi:DNA-binding NarL/FixJ family response regulator